MFKKNKPATNADPQVADPAPAKTKKPSRFKQMGERASGVDMYWPVIVFTIIVCVALFAFAAGLGVGKIPTSEVPRCMIGIAVLMVIDFFMCIVGSITGSSHA